MIEFMVIGCFMSSSTALKCSLKPDQQEACQASIQSEIIDQVTSLTEINNGFVLEFLYSKRLYEKLESFIEFERDCCGFLSFAISGNKLVINLVVDGPPEAAQVVASYRKIIEGEY